MSKEQRTSIHVRPEYLLFLCFTFYLLLLSPLAGFTPRLPTYHDSHGPPHFVSSMVALTTIQGGKGVSIFPNPRDYCSVLITTRYNSSTHRYKLRRTKASLHPARNAFLLATNVPLSKEGGILIKPITSIRSTSITSIDCPPHSNRIDRC